jgi:hypothetical protein
LAARLSLWLPGWAPSRLYQRADYNSRL